MTLNDNTNFALTAHSHPPTTVQVLIAGGCHVVGYAVGQHNSFVDHTFAPGLRYNILRMSPLPLTHGDRIRQHLEQQTTDILVLQMGNYESIFSLKLIFGAWRNAFWRPAPKSNQTPAQSSAEGESNAIEDIRLSSSFALKEWLRNSLYILWRFSGQSLFKRKHMHAAVKDFWSKIETVRPPLTVVVLPLPSAMRSTNRLRIMLGKVMENTMQSSADRRVVIVRFPDEAFYFQGSFANQSHLVNAGHLSIEGHMFLASLVRQAIDAVASSAYTDDPPKHVRGE